MEKEAFFRHLQHSNAYTLHDKLDIQSEKSKYPYCSALQVLDILSDNAVNIYNWEERFFQKVALQVPDSNRLIEMLSNVIKTEISSQEDLKLKQQIEAVKKKELGEISDENFDVIEAINSYQEISFKTAPKSVIIEKFLDSDSGKNLKNETNEILSIEDLGKKSIAEKDDLATETLAIVFEKQGKLEKAIAIYEKLMIKYPEKKSIFANQISALKNKLENNK